MTIIEKKGVAALQLLILKSEYLDPFIDTNDRTPSWDGYIYVYGNSQKNKEHFRGKIPVQVKSSEVKSFSGETRTYSFDVVDLKNYSKDGGIILFVVEFILNKHRIYFKRLLPADLKKILWSIKNIDQKTKVLKFRLLDNENLKVLENLCNNFLLHKKKQFSTIDYTRPIGDFTELSSTFVSDGIPFYEYLLSNEIPFYGKLNGGDIDIFVQNFQCDSLSTKVNQNVFVNGKKFYENYEVIILKEQQIFKFGQDIRLNVSPSKLSYKFSGLLSEQIRDCEFLVELIKEKRLFIDSPRNLLFTITNLSEEEAFLGQVRNYLKILIDISSLLRLFYIDPNKLCISENGLEQLDRESIQNLFFLVTLFIYHKLTQFTTKNLGFHFLKIGNLTIGIMVAKIDGEDNYRIYNLFAPMDDLQFRATTPTDENIELSPYVLLQTDALIQADNLDLAIVFADIKRYGMNKDYSTLVTLFGLELIKAFDASKRVEFLQSAADLFVWLEQFAIDREICRINELQVYRRQRNFTEEEKLELFQMREKFNDVDRMLCAINLLLENKTDYEIHFNRLTETLKEEFKGYPIYVLGQILFKKA